MVDPDLLYNSMWTILSLFHNHDSIFHTVARGNLIYKDELKIKVKTVDFWPAVIFQLNAVLTSPNQAVTFGLCKPLGSLLLRLL